VLLLEALRALNSTQEIAFGAVLLAFVVACPGGLVSIARRYLPHWDEPLHIAELPADAVPAQAGAPPPAPVGTAQ
jgi:hypothetical protein